MFKIIGILFMVLAFFAILAFMLFASAIFSIIRKLRKMLHGETDRHDYTGRRQQQYSYRGGATGQQSANTQHTRNNQQSTGSNSETIIDTRSPHTTGNRIFDDNEGEYVDFVEEQ